VVYVVSKLFGPLPDFAPRLKEQRVENESRLKRFAWSVAATVVAAAIWLLSPLGELFFFPRHQSMHDKVTYTLPFLAVMFVLVALFSDFVRNKKLLLVVLSSSVAGVLSSAVIFLVGVVYSCYIQGKWLSLSSPGRVFEIIVISLGLSLIRGTFALAAFIAIVYRYIPKAVGFLSRYGSALRRRS